MERLEIDFQAFHVTRRSEGVDEVETKHGTTQLTDEALLRARGWTPIAGGLKWRGPDGGERYCSAATMRAAVANDDVAEARERGSVTYRATAEQTHPVLLACAAKGMLERDVIAELAARVDALETELCRALEVKALGFKVVAREIRDPDAAHIPVDLGDGVRREVVVEDGALSGGRTIR
jgi:hypothetical protein